MSQTSLLVAVVVIVVVAFVLVRRMQPQPVQPSRLAVTAVIFVGLLLLSLASTAGQDLVHDVPALILAPVLLVAGGIVGLLLVRVMRFWTDEQTGALWMRGGLVFALIYLVTLVLRVGAQFVGQDKTLTAQFGWLPGISADLVLFSIGLWIVRAGGIYLRYRQHVAKGGTPAVAGPSR